MVLINVLLNEIDCLRQKCANLEHQIQQCFAKEEREKLQLELDYYIARIREIEEQITRMTTSNSGMRPVKEIQHAYVECVECVERGDKMIRETKHNYVGIGGMQAAPSSMKDVLLKDDSGWIKSIDNRCSKDTSDLINDDQWKKNVDAHESRIERQAAADSGIHNLPR